MKINRILLLLLCLQSAVCFAPSAPSPMAPSAMKMPKPGTPEFDDMITEQMKALETMLQDKSPEEQQEFIKALSDVGEQIIKDAKDKGYDDPFEYIATQIDAEMLESESEPEDLAEIFEPVATPAPPLVTSATSSLERLLDVLSQHVASLRQKTVADAKLSAKVSMIRYRLDDLVYYVELFKNDNLIAYLSTPDNALFVKKLENLELEVSPLLGQLVVPAFNLEGNDDYSVLGIASSASPQEITSAYHKLMAKNDPAKLRSSLAKEGQSSSAIANATLQAQVITQDIEAAYKRIVQSLKATNLVDALVEAFIQATDKDGIVDEFKNVLKKYEPTLALERENVQKAEAQARSQQEAAIKARPAFRLLESSSFESSAWRPSFNDYSPGSSSGNLYNPSANSTAKNNNGGTLKNANPPSLPSAKADKAGKDIKKSDDKDADKKSKDPKSSSPQDVERRIGATESVLAALKDTLKKNKDLLDGMTAFLVSPADGSKDTALISQYQTLFDELTNQFSMIPAGIKRGLSTFKDDKKKAYQEGIKKEWESFSQKDEYKTLSKLMEFLSKLGADGKQEVHVVLPGKSLPSKTMIDETKRQQLFGKTPQDKNYVAALLASHAAAKASMEGSDAQEAKTDATKEQAQQETPTPEAPRRLAPTALQNVPSVSEPSNNVVAQSEYAVEQKEQDNPGDLYQDEMLSRWQKETKENIEINRPGPTPYELNELDRQPVIKPITDSKRPYKNVSLEPQKQTDNPDPLYTLDKQSKVYPKD